MSNKIAIKRTAASKALKPVIAYADANGWELGRTNGGHLRFRKSGRQPIHCASTPSCHHAVRNILADLTRSDRHATA